MYIKKTSLLIVLLASMTLLAGNIISHHHHQGRICIDNSHCLTNEKSCGHEHDNRDMPDLCILKTPVVLPSHQDISSHIYFPELPLSKDKVCTFCLTNISTHIAGELHRYVLFDSNIYRNLYINTSSGLRSPPLS